jgi:hypothetical protein
MLLGSIAYSAYNYFTPEEKPNKQEDKNKEDDKQDQASDWKTYSCGKKQKYENLSWWPDFKRKIEKIDFYSEEYLQSALEGKDHEDYCSENPDSDYCKENKLKVNQLGEGCLLRDNSLFVGVFPGKYGGVGNYIVKYSIDENKLEIAEKDNRWFAPPMVFETKHGKIIKMRGGSGDAGHSVENNYEYNYITNEIKLVKKCFRGPEQKENCETFD